MNLIDKQEEYIKKILSRNGILIKDIDNLLDSNIDYSKAIPILLDILDIEDLNILLKETIIRSLATKEAKGKVAEKLILIYNKTPKKYESFRWAIGNTVEVTCTKNDLIEILNIIKDKSNGTSRQMFVLALKKFKNDKDVYITLINSLNDNDIILHVLGVLNNIEIKEIPKDLINLLNHENKLVIKRVKKILEKNSKLYYK